MEKYLNKSGNSPITHYEIGIDFIIVRFKGGKDYIYSYKGKAGKYNVDIMKSLAVRGSGLSAYITKNVKYSYD
ncbi:MAG: hypothetical protein M0Q51_04185 [Bacteroidales bacterium]|nr:hypothetical protein [Bacteroidales bacterium]